MNKDVLEEIRGLLTEGEFNLRMDSIKLTHTVGKLITEQEGDITEKVQAVAVGLGRSERGFWYAVKLYDKYPNLDMLPRGKAISLNYIINHYLTGPSKCEHEEQEEITFLKCKSCGKGLGKK